jgi:regulator of protease activity HflC (stomatin/prohibitin superfamily)
MTDVKNRIFKTVVTVPEGERALVLVNGKLDSILRPGRHSFASLAFMSLGRDIKVETHRLEQRALTSTYADPLETSRVDLKAAHFTEVRTAAHQVAVIERDGRLHGVLKPDAKVLYWTDAGPWKVDLVDTSVSLEVDPKLAQRIASLGATPFVKRFNVDEGQVGLLYVDGELVKSLKAGTHAYWAVGPVVNVKIVDTREHALDVSGQEILTRDKVSIRVNLAAKYRVVDPVVAVSAVKDFTDALYRALQHAFRQSLAAKSLDELLTRKGEVDGEAAQTVRSEMAKIGLEVGDIAIKDVVLPGDMRDILNKVVAAEKEAEANVIRRREETNATRSLLNTAKVMAENPVMMRLKELEALEKTADKVQTLTVHNGTRGLLEDLVSLKGDQPKSSRTKA